MKQKISKILVAMDGSSNSFRALDEAIYLARQCHGKITGLCIIPIYSVNLGRLLTPLRIQSMREANKFFEKAKKHCAQNGIQFTGKIKYGNLALEITEFAIYKKFDLIVIGSRGMSRIKQTFLGSVSNQVVHISKIPVLIVK